MNVDQYIADRMRSFRHDAHMSQADLAARMDGWHPTTVAKIEQGERLIKASEIMRLASCLHRPIEAFYPDPPERLIDVTVAGVTMVVDINNSTRTL